MSLPVVELGQGPHEGGVPLPTLRLPPRDAVSPPFQTRTRGLTSLKSLSAWLAPCCGASPGSIPCVQYLMWAHVFDPCRLRHFPNNGPTPVSARSVSPAAYMRLVRGSWIRHMHPFPPLCICCEKCFFCMCSHVECTTLVFFVLPSYLCTDIQ